MTASDYPPDPRAIIAIYIDPHDGSWVPIKNKEDARGLHGSMAIHPSATEEDVAVLRECASFSPASLSGYRVDLATLMNVEPVAKRPDYGRRQDGD